MVGVVDMVAVMGIGLQLFSQGVAFFTRSNTCDGDDS